MVHKRFLQNRINSFLGYVLLVLTCAVWMVPGTATAA